MIDYKIIKDTRDILSFSENYSHNKTAIQENVHNIDAPESYNNDNVLTDKGVLICLIGQTTENNITTYLYHVYDIFDISSTVNFDDIKPCASGRQIDRKTLYEMECRLVLYKNDENKYYTKPYNVMKINNKWWFRLNAEAIKYNNVEYKPDNDGYFKMNEKPVEIYEIGMSSKLYLTYIINDNTGVSVSTPSGTYDLTDTNGNIETDDFSSEDNKFMSFNGTSESPEIIYVRIY